MRVLLRALPWFGFDHKDVFISQVIVFYSNLRCNFCNSKDM